MIKIRLEYNDYGNLIATGRHRRLPIGHQVMFTLPEGSVLHCVTVGPVSTCDECPFLGLRCPIISGSCTPICPNGGYIIKSSNVMEEL
jgi:hypothetical protein